MMRAEVLEVEDKEKYRHTNQTAHEKRLFFLVEKPNGNATRCWLLIK